MSDRVLKGLECCIGDVDNDCDHCPYKHKGCTIELHKDAIDALKQANEQPIKARVLDINEVLTVPDRLVWIEWRGCNIRNLSPTAFQTHGDFSVCFYNGEVHPIGLYGKQWRCWNLKPTNAESEKWDAEV